MRKFRAWVQDGRLRLDVPTELPDGTVIDLTYADESEERFAADYAEFTAATNEWLRQVLSRGHADPGLEQRMDRARAALRAAPQKPPGNST